MGFRTPQTVDIRGQVVFLGTGTSVGVPMIGCDCSVCNSSDPRNNRTRCSIVLGLPEGNLLVDTPPDLRTQLLRERIGIVHATVYTHEHADHLFGLDDLRLFQFYLGGSVPLYCEEQVEARIRKSFDYAFAEPISSHAGSVPKLRFHRIGTEPFDVLGATVTPIRLEHGLFQVLGFRVGNFAYCTDVSGIPEQSWPRLAGLDTLVLGALRHKPHPTHLSVQQAIDVGQRTGAKQVLFTHTSHDLEYTQTTQRLPAGMSLAYDGLRVALT